MKIGFYHEVTWRGNSTTTKWRLVFIIKILEGDTPPLQNVVFICFYHQVTWREHFNTTKWRLVFYHQVTWRGHSTTINEDRFFICFYHQVTWREHFRRATSLATKMRLGFYMLSSDGQILLLQNDFRFFKGLSTTETLTTYKMQFPSCGYKMPGPSPFFHLNLSLERPWNGAQGLPFCSWKSNGDSCIISCIIYDLSWYIILYNDVSSVLSDVSCQLFNIHICYRCFKLSQRFVRSFGQQAWRSWMPASSNIQLSLQPELPEWKHIHPQPRR